MFHTHKVLKKNIKNVCFFNCLIFKNDNGQTIIYLLWNPYLKLLYRSWNLYRKILNALLQNLMRILELIKNSYLGN